VTGASAASGVATFNDYAAQSKYSPPSFPPSLVAID
jgi:hypothetical protein